jgi:succinate dehydrogenase / fumarate reductase flavoprotein subunit
MATEIPGLLVAGEAVGGANGANRLSGNAVTEALVFGRRAGRRAAAHAQRLGAQPFDLSAAKAALDLVSDKGATSDGAAVAPNFPAMILALQGVMADFVGPFRTQEGLVQGLAKIAELASELGEHPFGGGGPFDMRRIDWFDLRNMLLVARAVAAGALRRTESRGAHQREDFPGMLPEWHANQFVRWRDGDINLTSVPVSPAGLHAPPHPLPEAGEAKTGAMAAAP